MKDEILEHLKILCVGFGAFIMTALLIVLFANYPLLLSVIFGIMLSYFIGFLIYGVLMHRGTPKIKVIVEKFLDD